MISVKDAAKDMKCTPQHIRELIRNGKIKASKNENVWKIDKSSLKRELLERGISPEFPLHKRRKNSLNALSFFSGAMGMDLGLKRAGFEVCIASEIDKHAIATIKVNEPHVPVIGDIRNYSKEDILAISGFNDSEAIDLIVGGPPCQAFSTAGKRHGFNDERGNVFLKFIDVICQIRPRYVVLENVRGLLSAPLVHRPHNERGRFFPALTPEEQAGGALKEIIKILEKSGYGISFNLYNSAVFGTPQIRERVVIICSRDSSEAPYIMPTHSNEEIYSLPPFKTFRDVASNIKTHEHIHFPEKRKRFYRLLSEGQNWRNLPVELQKEAMGNSFYAGGGKTGFLRRLAWNKPSPTLVTHPAMPATDLAHPDEVRPLSIEEYKRIQQFPDDWQITGKTLDKYRQIGNAVPVGMGEAIGNHIVKLLMGESIYTPENFRYSRYRKSDHRAWMKANSVSDGMSQFQLAI